MTETTTPVDRKRRLAEVRRHLEVVGVDVDAEHEVYHPDAVLEFPQSRERFEGVENFRAWRGQYPGKVALRPVRDRRRRRRLGRASPRSATTEAPWRPAVAVLEYRGDRVEHETIYVTEHIEPPAWREQWRAR